MDQQQFQVATYREIQAQFGLRDTDHARITAKRKGWAQVARNHPADPARVQVPLEDWSAATPSVPRRTRPDAPPDSTPDQDPSPALSPPLQQPAELHPHQSDLDVALLVGALGSSLEHERARAERAEAEAQAAQLRADHAMERVDRFAAEAQAALLQAQFAGLERDALQRTLADLTAGGRVARAVRALLYR